MLSIGNADRLTILIAWTQTKFRDKFGLIQRSTMQAREHIRSISYLKSHAAQISEDVAANGAPYIITQNGEAVMVIEGVRQYQDKEDLIALLKLLALSEKDRQAGLGLSVQEARAQLAQRRQPAKPQA